MVDASDISFVDELRPFRLLAFETLESTNTKASEVAEACESRDPFIVFTEKQTQGRGRGSNIWIAHPGVLTATFAIPCSDRFPSQFVPLIAGLAVVDACRKLGVTSVGLKWPNDVWSNRLKLAGLLCERKSNFDLIGVGMNVCNPIRELPYPLATRSTSLSELVQKNISIKNTLAAIANAMACHFITPKLSLADYLQNYSENLVLKGCRIRVSDPVATNSRTSLEGICEGVDDEGRIVVVNSTGRHACYTGNVTVLESITS